MTPKYHPDTDSLYIDLSERPSTESHEIAEGIVLDYDDAGCPVGIDFDNASGKAELTARIAALDAGEVETMPWSEVRDRLLAKLNERYEV